MQTTLARRQRHRRALQARPNGGGHLVRNILVAIPIILLLVTLLTGAAGALFTVAAYNYYAQGLPDPKEIIESMSSLKPIIPIGPLVSPSLLGANQDQTLDGENLDMWKADDHCMKWLDKQARSSVVYISFGSLLKSSENQVESIATALRNRGVSFLWVLRPKENAQNVAVWQEMVQEGQGVVIEWGPQERILSHVAISCFVTHCGWNSTIETVAAGVPVVAYPSWTDQQIDARLLVDVFGIGVRMRNDAVEGELKVTEVERCIEAVTKGTAAAGMRKRVTELKQAARLAMAPGGSSAQNLDSFIRDITII